jgi:glycosyltransferase involved in cell wall biosynthesis
MNILLIEPYFTGSHKSWAEDIQKFSSNNINILSMKGQFWKWRMQGSAITLAQKFNKLKIQPDLIIATDMLDLTTFLSLTRKTSYNIPTVMYFHENQLSYPWSKKDRDFINKEHKHYGFINYSSALAADKVLFNSNYHKNSFLNELKLFLKRSPDHNELETIKEIKDKSKVLYIGIDLKRFDDYKNIKKGPPLILWNHRWEYDKNPEIFFKVLFDLQNKEIDYRVAILGERHNKYPSIFDEAKEKLKSKIVQFGYCNSAKEYAKWLWKADILPVTNNQDFFGISIMEAMHCNTYPLLPNRLSYPELIPSEYHHEHIYFTEDDLFNKLNLAIRNIQEIRNLTFNQIAEPYDWSRMISVYDQLLLSFIK